VGLSDELQNIPAGEGVTFEQTRQAANMYQELGRVVHKSLSMKRRDGMHRPAMSQGWRTG
jgi:hypothetical protein